MSLKCIKHKRMGAEVNGEMVSLPSATAGGCLLRAGGTQSLSLAGDGARA